MRLLTYLQGQYFGQGLGWRIWHWYFWIIILVFIPNYGGKFGTTFIQIYQMGFVSGLSQYILPLAMLLFFAYMLANQYFKHQSKTHGILRQQTISATVTPLQIQAYERLCLYLERTSFAQLMPRLTEKVLTATELQLLVSQEINEEFYHNLAQQIYVSDKAWEAVCYQKEWVISQTNHVAAKLPADATARDLAKAMYQMQASLPENTPNPIATLKAEARAVLGII
jgi:hypothetical protein